MPDSFGVIAESSAFGAGDEEGQSRLLVGGACRGEHDAAMFWFGFRASYGEQIKSPESGFNAARRGDDRRRRESRRAAALAACGGERRRRSQRAASSGRL